MVQVGPDQVLTTGQTASPPVFTPPSPSAEPSAPAWMTDPVMVTNAESRRGHSAKASRLNTFLFFGLIVFVVGAAGLGGVVMWGPEKTVKNRTQFATNPPQPTTLPSLPTDQPPVVPPVATVESEPAPAPTDAALASAAAAPKKGSKKGSPKAVTKKH